jgi:hypothetical protein
MKVTHQYRVQLDFNCDHCGHPNLHVAYISSDLKTENEIGFLIENQPPPKCTRCQQLHRGDLGIGVQRVAESA